MGFPHTDRARGAYKKIRSSITKSDIPRGEYPTGRGHRRHVDQRLHTRNASFKFEIPACVTKTPSTTLAQPHSSCEPTSISFCSNQNVPAPVRSSSPSSSSVALLLHRLYLSAQIDYPKYIHTYRTVDHDRPTRSTTQSTPCRKASANWTKDTRLRYHGWYGW